MSDKQMEGRSSTSDRDHALALAAEHHERLPSRLPRWRLEHTLFAALSTATYDMRPSLVTRDGVSGFLIDAAQRRFTLMQLAALDYAELRPSAQPWQVVALAPGRNPGAAAEAARGPRWDGIDALRFVACLLESSGAIAMPIELGKRYKMLKWPDLGALPGSRDLLRPYLRHSKELARGNRSIGEILANAGAEWREALAFANACAMLDLLQAVEE